MEISGRVLREVEFRDRLRGYDTEEVDEFLEKVATALDAVLIELDQARTAAAAAEANPVDDESLRRTLVLAQRTADLAIKEARDEATALLEDARTQSDTLVGSARDEAKRLRESAESETQAKISELEDRRIELEGEIESLSSFVDSERRKLMSGLSTALEVVGESLKSTATPSAMSQRPNAAPAPQSDSGVTRRGRRSDADDESGPPTRLIEATELDVDDETTAGQLALAGSADKAPPSVEDAAPSASIDLETEVTSGSDALSVSDEAALAEVESVVDPDEELWQRWAKGADLDVSSKDKGRVVRAPAKGERRRGWTA